MINFFLEPEDPNLLEKVFYKFRFMVDLGECMVLKDNYLVTNDLWNFKLNQCLKFDDEGNITDGYCIVPASRHFWNSKLLPELLCESRGCVGEYYDYLNSAER